MSLSIKESAVRMQFAAQFAANALLNSCAATAINRLLAASSFRRFLVDH
jgi:uncharacterized protein